MANKRSQTQKSISCMISFMVSSNMGNIEGIRNKDSSDYREGQ